MSEQDNKPQEGTNPEPEVVEETEVVEEKETTPEEPAEEQTEDTVPKSQFNQVLARAKKAEADLKAAKADKKPEAPITKGVSPEQVEISILKSQGMSQELIEELQTLAKVRGKSLIDTQNDPIFVTMKEKREADDKAKKAKLGASKGSGTAKTPKNLNSPGLSKEDHKAMWREAQK